MIFDKFKKLKKYDPEAERTLREEIEAEGGLEKNDVKAMIISALLVIVPVILIIFVLFVLMAWVFLAEL